MRRPRQVIIVGSGVAGLYCALQCAQHSQVTVVTKNTIVESSSSYAQGGIAAVLATQDTFAQHRADTLNAGAYHNSVTAVNVLVKEAPRHIAALIQLGVHFSINQLGHLDLTKEGGHSQRRIVHVKDMTGLGIERALIAAVKRHPAIRIQSWEFALDLINQRQRVVGLDTIHLKTKRHRRYVADAMVLATGGCGQAYPYTSNPPVVTGDGIAMAIRAGARVKDLEFVQFHPTAYYLPGQAPFLLSETLRGEGAYLRDHGGRRFVNELKPRDYVSRAVYREQRHGLVYLDFRHKPARFLLNRFPGIYRHLKSHGLLLHRDLIPITPVAHYLCGGIHTDVFGQTSLAGLYAIGEAAHTGVHGANRLASNSLLECLVFAARAAEVVGTQSVVQPSHNSSSHRQRSLHLNHTDTFIGLRQQLHNVMWETGGIVRTAAGLESGVAKMAVIKQTIQKQLHKQFNLPGLELVNMATVAEQILQAALKRRHSLGCHYRVN